jgi:hypothetical protein
MQASMERRGWAAVLAALVLAVAVVGPAAAQSQFPKITYRVFAGVPSSTGADSTVSRKVTIRWLRDRTAESRPDFGGYRIYRQETRRDTTNMLLLRRFSVRGATAADTLANGQPNLSIYARRDTLLWYFPDNQDTLQFVDPDSSGDLAKVIICKEFNAQGRCIKGDSAFAFQRLDGPHDGYALYYTITYGSVDRTLKDTDDMFVPDSLDNYARCGTPGDPSTCPNLNGKLTNLMVDPIYVRGPATTNLQSVAVVPNPYRGHEQWDQPGQNRIQFQNLPAAVKVRIFTVAGDLVRELVKTDPESGSLDWDLKNADSHDVASGIYLFRITSSQGFEQTGHFVIIR